MDTSTTSNHQPVVVKKSYECVYPECGKSFSTSSNLTQHTLIHTDERPHVCNLCGRAFRQSGNLSKHKKSHDNAHLRWDRSTSSKPFKCQEIGCEKSFTANNSLQNHMRKHTGEQPYACPYGDCTERFTLKTGLQTHLKLHEALSGQRSICLHAACRKSFKTEMELRNHIYISCPGLVEEAAALRSTLALIVKQYDAEKITMMPNLNDVIQKGKDLLNMLPNEYMIRRDDVVESCRVNLSNCCADGSSTCNNFMITPLLMKDRITSAWNLHKDAAAEVASSTSSTKTAAETMLPTISTASRVTVENGISTLIMAAAEDFKSDEHESNVPVHHHHQFQENPAPSLLVAEHQIDRQISSSVFLPSPTSLTLQLPPSLPPVLAVSCSTSPSEGSANKKRTFQEIYTEKFFRNDLSSNGGDDEAPGYI